jgi:hypothetical protein
MTKECAKQMAESMSNFFKIYDDYKHFGFNNRVHLERDMQVFMSAQMEAMNVMMLQVLNDNYEELAEQ